MAIPASVMLYTNWGLGSLVSTTYTQATPEVPNAHTWTTGASLTVETDSPWNGQTLLDLTAVWHYSANTTVSSSTVQATSGRFLIEIDTMADNHLIMDLREVNRQDGWIVIDRSSGNLLLRSWWNAWNSEADVAMGTFPTSPFALEVIYDFNNATANQRFRARTWTIGGTPGSFTDATRTTGSAATASQFTSLQIGNADDWSIVRVGRVIFSNSITEDLSQVTEAAAAAALPRRALDGPFYGPLRGSVR